jgi:hypothetical protein
LPGETITNADDKTLLDFIINRPTIMIAEKAADLLKATRN